MWTGITSTWDPEGDTIYMKHMPAAPDNITLSCEHIRNDTYQLGTKRVGQIYMKLMWDIKWLYLLLQTMLHPLWNTYIGTHTHTHTIKPAGWCNLNETHVICHTYLLLQTVSLFLWTHKRWHASIRNLKDRTNLHETHASYHTYLLL